MYFDVSFVGCGWLGWLVVVFWIVLCFRCDDSVGLRSDLPRFDG